jgi:hypothetical protein
LISAATLLSAELLERSLPSPIPIHPKRFEHTLSDAVHTHREELFSTAAVALDVSRGGWKP